MGGPRPLTPLLKRVRKCSLRPDSGAPAASRFTRQGLPFPFPTQPSPYPRIPTAASHAQGGTLPSVWVTLGGHLCELQSTGIKVRQP